jgi:hypothetical protein
MASWRRQIPVPRRAATVGVNGPHDLGVNPISHLVLHVDGVVAGASSVGHDVPFTDITNITVLFQGASVLNLSARDLEACVAVLTRKIPYVINHASATNGDVVRVSMMIPFGRKAFMADECFPATKKGDLQMQLTFGAEGATFQSRNYSIESIELPEASPKRFLKLVSLTRALTATDFDFPLPQGNQYSGIMIQQPTVLDAGIATGTIRQLKLLVDNVEHVVAASRYESLRDQFEMLVSDPDVFANGAIPWTSSYAYIDLNPLMDDSYLLDTDGRSDVRFRFELDNAGSPRVIPVELVGVPGGAS